jgi:hypothetical protein
VVVGCLLLCLLCVFVIFGMRKGGKERVPPTASGAGKYDTQTDASQMGPSAIEMQSAEPSVGAEPSAVEGETETTHGA